jgi:hypothetical protein
VEVSIFRRKLLQGLIGLHPFCQGQVFALDVFYQGDNDCLKVSNLKHGGGNGPETGDSCRFHPASASDNLVLLSPLPQQNRLQDAIVLNGGNQLI